MSQDPRELARRQKPVSGSVEDYLLPEDDPDAPSAEDVERFSDVTIKCSECGTELFDDVAVCWKCGRAQGGSDEPAKVPVWAVATVVVIIAGFLMFMGARLLF